jgi:hypothetical protein
LKKEYKISLICLTIIVSAIIMIRIIDALNVVNEEVTGTGTIDSFQLTVAPSFINYGECYINGTYSRTITATNEGTKTLDVTVQETQVPNYILVYVEIQDMQLAAGESTDIIVYITVQPFAPFGQFNFLLTVIGTEGLL